MIQTAVTDVVSPAVAAEDPEALLGRYCLSFRISLAHRSRRLEGSDQSLGGLIVGLGVVLGSEEVVDDSIQLSILALQGSTLVIRLARTVS